MKINIAIPSYSGKVSLELMSSIMAFHKPEGSDFIFTYVDRTFIDRARNALIMSCLIAKCDYILMIDDDQLPPVDIVTLLVKEDKDIIGVPIANRKGAHELNVFDDNYDKVNEFKGKAKEVGAIGSGVILIKAEVLQAMLEKHRTPFEFKMEDLNGEEREFSEDVLFCKRARELGYKVWAKGIVVPHIGDPVKYRYDGEFKNSITDKL